jgi:hypothetical protein
MSMLTLLQLQPLLYSPYYHQYKQESKPDNGGDLLGGGGSDGFDFDPRAGGSGGSLAVPQVTVTSITVSFNACERSLHNSTV